VGGFGSLLALVPKRRLAVAMVVNESAERGDGTIRTLVTEVLNDAGIATPWTSSQAGLRIHALGAWTRPSVRIGARVSPSTSNPCSRSKAAACRWVWTAST